MFKEGQRYFYKRNPLDNVIVQFRFSPLLEIEASLPTAFQKQVAGICPDYNVTQIVQQQVNIRGDVQNPIPSWQIQSPITNKVYIFKNPKEKKTIELTMKSLTVTFSKYVKWEEFKEVFMLAKSSLESIYGISYYTRIGLRYIDKFLMEKLNLRKKDMEWKDLINPVFLGLASIGNMQAIGFQSINEVSLGEHNAKAVIKMASLRGTDDKKICGIVLDYDCSIEENTAKDDSPQRLEFLHTQSRNIFEFAIKQKLRNAMGVEDYD
jgi:uncharacterized protein (TIGR04255 family)